MNNTLNISNNNFYDQSCIIKEINEKSTLISLEDIFSELEEIRSELNPQSELYNAIKDLQEELHIKNEGKIKSTIQKYAKEFSIPFFANVASSTLMEYIKNFL